MVKKFDRNKLRQKKNIEVLEKKSLELLKDLDLLCIEVYKISSFK